MPSVDDARMHDLTWQPQSMVAAVEAWWAAERHRTPTFDAFLARRKAILDAIPAETSWWRVGPITFRHLRDVHAISTFHADGKSRLLDVGNHMRRHAIPWPTMHDGDWGGILLFGHNRMGPFTVFEGNHRMLAAACYGQAGAFMPDELHVNIALSLEPCRWHRPLGYQGW